MASTPEPRIVSFVEDLVRAEMEQQAKTQQRIDAALYDRYCSQFQRAGDGAPILRRSSPVTYTQQMHYVPSAEDDELMRSRMDISVWQRWKESGDML